MKTCFSMCSLVISVAMCCQADAHDLLGRLLGRGGCGCPTTCCDTPSSCGRGFHLHLDLSLQLPRLRGNGCGSACDSGCDSGCGAAVAAPSCGCDQPAAPCSTGCDSGCGNGCGGGLLSGFSGFNLGRRLGGCGCDAAPACDSCNSCDPCSRVSLLDNVRGRFACRQPRCPRQICINVPNFGLIDRLRSFGNNGCGCDSGCNAGCDSGCGNAVSSSCGCNGGAISAPAAAPMQQGAPIEPTPVQTPAAGGASNIRTPVVDPNAFIIRGAKYAGGR